MAAFTTITVSVEDAVGQLVLNRPAKGNAISKEMWEELPRGVQWLLEQGARVVRSPPPTRLPTRLVCWPLWF